MKKFTLLAAFAASSAVPALAQDAGQSSDDVVQASNGETQVMPDAAKPICKKQEVTGSLVRTRKVCRTKAEWDRMSQDMQNQVRDYVDHGRGGTNGN